MKDTLLEIQSKFGKSKAVFSGVLTSSNSYVEFECIEPYNPQTAELDHSDPIVKLMVDNYSERFDKNDLFYITNGTNTVTRNMFNAIKRAFTNASPLKNPQQSKLYKWLEHDRMFTSLQKREGMIALFRYIRAHTDDNFRFHNGSDNPHAKNLVAILEKMKEQYERR